MKRDQIHAQIKPVETSALLISEIVVEQTWSSIMTRSPTSKTCVEKMKINCKWLSGKVRKNARGLTDSKRVWAECPNTKEKPRTILARGTSDAMVLVRSKINKQMKIMTITATQSRTASSFATIESTSYAQAR